MTTAALAFTDAIVALLKAPTALCGGRVVRGRAVPVQLEDDSQIFVRLVRSRGQPLDLAGLHIRWQTLIGIEIALRAKPRQDAHAAVDDPLAAVYARLATAPVPAGADGWALQPDINWETAEADSTVSVATLAVQITHNTGPSSLVALA